MKVLILNTSERTGGAAVAANRLMKALCKQGVEAKMLVRDKQSADERITSVNQSLWQRRLNFWRFAWERLVIFLSNKLDRKQLFRVSIANTGVDIVRHPLVSEADVIHLHWVNQGFLSLESIRQLIATGKPIVWTMHDLWPASSICHYAGQCERYQASCGQCFYLHSSRKDLSSLIFRRKQRIYDQAQIAFVCCSQWLRGRAALSQLLRQQRLTAIPNPIDQSLYRPQERTAARQALGLPLGKPLLLFGALDINDERKGIDYLVEALRRLPADSVELVVFGQAKGPICELLPVKIHAMGYLSDDRTIASLYSAVDLYVTSSLEDNLPNTIMEALACGTPCLGFRTGGIPEMIDHAQNGYVANYRDAADLAKGIEWVIRHPYPEALRQACVRKVQRCYAEPVVAQQYIALYEQLLKTHE